MAVVVREFVVVKVMVEVMLEIVVVKVMVEVMLEIVVVMVMMEVMVGNHRGDNDGGSDDWKSS
jgi:hypothetical protein